jgi:hypothetical protein
MIWESAPWKEQLVRDAARLRRLGRTELDDEDSERAFFTLERLVFLATYSMRKLWESGKLSSDWNHQRLACQRFPIKGRIPDTMNWHHIDRHYDMNKSTDVKMKPEEFWDRIIHSFIFVPVIGDDKAISSFFFSSDTMRRHAIWLMHLGTVADLMKITGKDFPSSMRQIRGEDGQWITWSGHGDPPESWTKIAERKRRD